MAQTALDQFDAVVARFGKIAGYALGGSVLAPLVTAASGMAPAWPDGLPIITSIFMLLSLILIFHFLTTRKRWIFSLLLVGGSLCLVASILGYAFARGEFVMKGSRSNASLTIGCTWRPEAVELATRLRIDTKDQCPGDFRELLAKAEDDPYQIWTERSITNVSYVIACLWVALFTTLALVIGSFVIWYTRQPAGHRSARRTR